MTRLFYRVAKLIVCPTPAFNPIPHWGGGGGGADFTRLQIVFFITSVMDAVESQNLVTFSKI